MNPRFSRLSILVLRCLRVYRVEKPAAPLPSYRDDSAFKLYLHDVGLLAAALDLTPASVVLGDDGLTEFRGALTEQYVCQQLVAAGITPMYWSNANSTGEVDFVFAGNGAIIPLEAKAGTERHKRSLMAVRQIRDLRLPYVDAELQGAGLADQCPTVDSREPLPPVVGE